MRRESITKLFMIVTAVLLVMSFAGCDLFVEPELIDDVTVESRGMGSEKSSDNSFTATVQLQQMAAETTQNGTSDQWKTRNETMVGYVVSGWDVINGASIEMDNFTNFNMVSIYGDPFYPAMISGTNHSTIRLVKDGEVIMTLKANGTIEGMFPVTAAVEMKVNTIGKSDNKLKGTIIGDFIWSFYGTVPVSSGTFELSGTYN